MEESVAVGSPHWVSQWATLAANHKRTDPEGSGAEPTHFVHQERGICIYVFISPDTLYFPHVCFELLVDFQYY